MDTSSTRSAKGPLSDNHVISVHLSPVFWRDEFLGTVSVLRDISLEVQVDQLKTDFIANISHELRTPLTSIKGYVEVLLMGASGLLNNQQKQFLNIIQSNTSRLTSLVDEILDISSIESGHIILKPQKFNIITKIYEVVENHKSLSINDNKQILYQIDSAEGIPFIHADPLRIEQILLNILNNARIYSFDKGVISISVDKDDKRVKINITDQGLGVPMEEQPLIFDRFYRGKYSIDKNSSGAGLGLSISKTLIEMQGGSISFISSGVPGEGSTVCITIPISDEKA